VDRASYLADIQQHFRIHAACAILGPRQVGKTTLARMYSARFSADEVIFFDLENPFDLARLENPMLSLSKLKNKFIIIDEIQRLPEFFPVLRVLIDNQSLNQKFLILGSVSRDLIQQSSESLAGRIGYVELTPFSLKEINNDVARLLIRGGFPKSFLAENDEDSYLWRLSYIMTFLERDIPNLGFQIPAQQMRRFWMMLAHYHGQILNVSELGKSMALSDHIVKKYVAILAGTCMIRVLTPWYANISKRQVKSPKIYLRDTGILNTLVGIKNQNEMDISPKSGSFWEGFALEEVIKETKAYPEECFFWSTQSKAELDLLLIKDGKKIGYEFKYSDKIKITPSMRIAIEDLGLDHLYVIYPGDKEFPLDEKITAKGL
jgi:predicted AAA+ superfamily ATPase